MSKNWVQNNMKFFLEVTFLWSFFRASWVEIGLNPSHPKKIACSYTYVVYHRIFRDFLVLF